MNLARKPFQGNPDLRKAFNYAVNRKAICEQVFEGTHTVSHGILPPGTPGFNPELKGYDYDPEKAREYLARAGYPGGKGLSSIDLWVNNNEKLLQTAQRVQADLAAVGIPVRIQAVDFANFLQAVQGTGQAPGEALFYKFGWQADYPDPDAFLYWLLHSRNAGPAGNMSRYSNPKVDDLLDRARNLVRMEDRVPLYREAERIAVEEDAVWLFVSNYTERFLVKPYVKGVILSPLGMSRTPFDRMWLEPPSSRNPEGR
jgi:peptide/nickel transport system substrate-binding protein/oligopeptide transport system substrate-binding protein